MQVHRAACRQTHTHVCFAIVHCPNFTRNNHLRPASPARVAQDAALAAPDSTFAEHVSFVMHRIQTTAPPPEPPPPEETVEVDREVEAAEVPRGIAAAAAVEDAEMEEAAATAPREAAAAGQAAALSSGVDELELSWD